MVLLAATHTIDSFRFGRHRVCFSKLCRAGNGFDPSYTHQPFNIRASVHDQGEYLQANVLRKSHLGDPYWPWWERPDWTVQQPRPYGWLWRILVSQ